MTETIIRFVLGGAIVSAFAVLGDLLRPKSFAGLFAAVPSVALVSLALVFISRGDQYGAVEGRSMLVGAVALMSYGALVGNLLLRRHGPTIVIATAGVVVWALLAAVGSWMVLQ